MYAQTQARLGPNCASCVCVCVCVCEQASAGELQGPYMFILRDRVLHLYPISFPPSPQPVPKPRDFLLMVMERAPSGIRRSLQRHLMWISRAGLGRRSRVGGHLGGAGLVVSLTSWYSLRPASPLLKITSANRPIRHYQNEASRCTTL